MLKKLMKVFFKIAGIISAIAAIAAAFAFVAERIEELKNYGKKLAHKPYGVYERFVKRPLDCFLSTGALIVFSPILAVTALLVRKKLGSPHEKNAAGLRRQREWKTSESGTSYLPG